MLWFGTIDDSADKNREKVIVSAALFGTNDAWTKLRSGWRKRLEEDGIAYFKSSDCQRLDGPFRKFRDPIEFPVPSGREAAIRIEADLDKLIHSCALFGVAAVIPVPVWEKLRNDPEYVSVCARDPYHWALQTVWTQCVAAMEELGRGNVIAFAHDSGDNYAILRQLYQGYKGKNEGSKRRLAGLVSLDDKTNSSIQAADVLASVTQRYAVEWLDDPTAVRLKRLEGSLYRISVWDDRFARLVLDNELKNVGATKS
jgi:hypothetical protein